MFFATVKGKNYAGEYTDLLSVTNWQPLGGVAGDGAERLITDTNALAGQRFYRIRLSP
jgi:hypothetical protein